MLADTCPFFGPNGYPCFGFLVTSSSGFQSQSGLPYPHCGGEHNVTFQLRSTPGATRADLLATDAQPVLSPHTCCIDSEVAVIRTRALICSQITYRSYSLCQMLLLASTAKSFSLLIQDRRPLAPGPVAEWLARRTHNPMLVGSSLTSASNILGQNMNVVDAPQCCLSRGWQCIAPEVECILHSPLQCK